MAANWLACHAARAMMGRAPTVRDGGPDLEARSFDRMQQIARRHRAGRLGGHTSVYFELTPKMLGKPRAGSMPTAIYTQSTICATLYLPSNMSG